MAAYDVVELDGYNLSNRTYNCLRRGGYTTAEQVRTASDADLLDIRGFGVGCLAEARAKLGGHIAEHTYLSTACLHNLHDYCQAMTGYQGEKRPAQCKFCDVRCVCTCHNPGAVA